MDQDGEHRGRSDLGRGWTTSRAAAAAVGSAQSKDGTRAGRHARGAQHVSGSPVSGSPVSGNPVSGNPVSGNPVSGNLDSGVWESMSELGTDFLELAPGVVCLPGSAPIGPDDHPAAVGLPPRIPARPGPWEGSARAPSRRASGSGAAVKANPTNRSGISRQRFILACAVGMVVVLGVLLLLGSVARPSGAVPPVVGAPAAPSMSPEPSTTVTAADPQLLLDAVPSAEESPDPVPGQSGRTAQSGQLAREQPAEQPSGQMGEPPSGQPGEQRSEQTSEQPAERRATATSSPDAGQLKVSGAVGLVEPQTDWLEVITRLDRVRAKSLTQLDSSVLAGAVAPGSAAWAADTALLGELRSRGVHPRSLRTQVVAVVRVGRGAVVGMTPKADDPAAALARGSAVTLLVTDRRAAYQLLDSKGAVVQRTNEAGKMKWQVTLIPADTEVGWLISDVVGRP